ncbi:hypothetical protein ScalyP_jg1233 [Parmales sp. scaly parma]|nr:hypothetical protein ScalyP_jg1233 [Parmales sp. scaly parma]
MPQFFSRAPSLTTFLQLSSRPTKTPTKQTNARPNSEGNFTKLWNNTSFASLTDLCETQASLTNLCETQPHDPPPPTPPSLNASYASAMSTFSETKPSSMSRLSMMNSSHLSTFNLQSFSDGQLSSRQTYTSSNDSSYNSNLTRTTNGSESSGSGSSGKSEPPIRFIKTQTNMPTCTINNNKSSLGDDYGQFVAVEFSPHSTTKQPNQRLIKQKPQQNQLHDTFAVTPLRIPKRGRNKF